MYDILTVLNEKYIKFGDIFFDSLAKTAGSDLRTLIVIDTGLSKDTRTRLSENSPLNIKWISNPYEADNSGEKEEYKSAEWHHNIDTKTRTLLELIDDVPVMMVDIDCEFRRNPSELLKDDVDISVCRREHSSVPALASFFVAYPTEKAKKFISDWISLMNRIGKLAVDKRGVLNRHEKDEEGFPVIDELIDEGYYKAKESPSLSAMLSEGIQFIDEVPYGLAKKLVFGNNEKQFDGKIYYLEDSVVSSHVSKAEENNAYIIHYKRATSKDTIEQRLAGFAASVHEAKDGVVYVVVGKRDFDKLDTSIKTVRKFIGKDIPITIWCDMPPHELPEYAKTEAVRTVKFERFKFPAREENRNSSLFRLIALRESPYENTLYLDNDIFIVNDAFREGFRIAEKMGVTMVENPRHFIKGPGGDITIGADVSEFDHKELESMPFGMMALNMGVTFYNHKSARFLQQCIIQQEQHPSRGQAGLARTIHKMNKAPYALPVHWLVCSRHEGIESPLALHAGHKNIYDWWKRDFECHINK